MQSDRIIKFTTSENIEKLTDTLKEYILEEIEVEESGKKVEFKKNHEPISDLLLEAFQQDPVLKKAFFELTLGRQRGYIIHFSQPKQSQT